MNNWEYFDVVDYTNMQHPAINTQIAYNYLKSLDEHMQKLSTEETRGNDYDTLMARYEDFLNLWKNNTVEDLKAAKADLSIITAFEEMSLEELTYSFIDYEPTL